MYNTVEEQKSLAFSGETVPVPFPYFLYLKKKTPVHAGYRSLIRL